MPARQSSTMRFLNWIERIGNRLPDPVTLFVIGAACVLIGSEFAARWQWSESNPATQEIIRAKSLLSREGLQWVWINLVPNFTGFPPLGVVLVAMIGIGVAEQSGLIGVLLKSMVLITPRALLTPAVVFVGIMSNMASDAGYVILPPLAAAMFLQAGRSPVVGLCAVFAGIASGFSANLLITSLDPLLQSFTQTAAQILDPSYQVDVRCNYYFMIASTFVMTLVGWGVTHWLVEPRFTAAQVEEQIRFSMESGGTAASAGGNRLTGGEKWGLVAAAIALALAGALVLALVLIPGAALHGDFTDAAGHKSQAWLKAIVPIIFFCFLVPGLAFGMATGSIRSDRDVAKMMSKTMSSMGTYIIMAFFAAQFVAWFNESKLGHLIALRGVVILQSYQIPRSLLLVALIAFTAFLNLFIGSASAKWALLSTVFVPVLAGLGISPELTQAGYRVGDSATNSIAPLNPYIVIILMYLQRVQPNAGIGSLISAMLPYAVVMLIVWTVMLLVWVALGLPLGPDNAPLFLHVAS